MGVDSLTLELDQFCIETTAKREYQRLMAGLLEEEDPRPGTQEMLELLRSFLGQEDFTAIRSAHPDLCGGTSARVQIFRDSAGRVCWARSSPEDK